VAIWKSVPIEILVKMMPEVCATSTRVVIENEKKSSLYLLVKPSYTGQLSPSFRPTLVGPKKIILQNKSQYEFFWDILLPCRAE
jgi:hypothetical protein